MSLADILSGNGTKTNVVSISPKLSPTQQAAVDVSRNLRMTAWLNKNPMISSKITALRTAKVVTDIQKSGISFVPTNTLTAQQNELNTTKTALETVTKTMQEQQTAQSDMFNRLSNAVQTLQQGTVQGAVSKAQLGYTTSAFETLKANPETVSTGIDFQTLIILGAVAIGGILVLSSVLGKKG